MKLLIVLVGTALSTAAAMLDYPAIAILIFCGLFLAVLMNSQTPGIVVYCNAHRGPESKKEHDHSSCVEADERTVHEQGRTIVARRVRKWN